MWSRGNILCAISGLVLNTYVHVALESVRVLDLVWSIALFALARCLKYFFVWHHLLCILNVCHACHQPRNWRHCQCVRCILMHLSNIVVALKQVMFFIVVDIDGAHLQRHMMVQRLFRHPKHRLGIWQTHYPSRVQEQPMQHCVMAHLIRNTSYTQHTCAHRVCFANMFILSRCC